MTKSNTNSKKGFTIIEVVLVLAIAGLIFLMVFIALPALQRGQRDTQRRNDMARFVSQLSQYQANNNGKVPADKSKYEAFISNYLKVGGDQFADPSTGNDYVIADLNNVKTKNNAHSGETEMGKIYVYTNATCDGEEPSYIQGDRRIAIILKLEGAGFYCGHN